MDTTWGTTRTGLTYHSFNSDGSAICRKNIRQPEGVSTLTEEQVDNRLAEAWGARVRGFRKCETCIEMEAAFRGRLEASLQPSTGEGDHIPPAQAATEITEMEENDMAENSPSKSMTGPLNKVQNEILSCVAAGWTHDRIARDRGVSKSWVSMNLVYIHNKTGAANTAQAIAMWTMARAYREAADLLDASSRAHPERDGVAEDHVNHVLARLAKMLRESADRILPA